MSEDMTAKQVTREIIEHLEVRMGDPWDDRLWPAAAEVLLDISGELREMYGIGMTDEDEYNRSQVEFRLDAEGGRKP